MDALQFRLDKIVRLSGRGHNGLKSSQSPIVELEYPADGFILDISPVSINL